MSRSEGAGAAAAVVAKFKGTTAQPQPGAIRRLLGNELRLVLTRRRTLALLVLLAGVPVLLGVVLAVVTGSAYSGQGPGFIEQVAENGMFLVVASLFLCLPFLLPFVVSIAAGDAIAGEAGTGTLRYLLLVPVPRTRLLMTKALGALAVLVAAVTVVTMVAFAVGGVLFGWNELVLLSGQSVGVGSGAARMLGIAAYSAVSLVGLLAVGIFFSTLTEVPIGAMAATLVVWIVSTVLDSLPQLAAIHPFLLTHYWTDFAELLRFEPSLANLWPGIAVQLGWAAVFGSLAWARFTTADITS